MEKEYSELIETLHQARVARNQSVQDLSRKIGISSSQLYRIESGGVYISARILMALCYHLGVNLPDLLEDIERRSDTRYPARCQIGSLVEKIEESSQDPRKYHLCSGLRRRRMDPLILKIRDKEFSGYMATSDRPAEIFTYVVDGSVVVHTEYYEPIELTAGQSIYLDSTMPHAYTVSGGFDLATLVSIWGRGVLSDW